MKILDSLMFQRGMLIKYQDYLKNGKYILNCNLRSYSHCDSQEMNVLLPHDNNASMIKRIIIQLFAVRIKNRNKHGGELVYFTNIPRNEYKDIKIFDLDNKKVITICQSKKRFDYVMKKRGFLADIFPLPSCLLLDEKNRIYIDELIEKDVTGQSNRGVIEVFNFYCNYYKSVTYKYVPISAIFSEPSIINESFFKANKNIPVTKAHGDLSIDNYVLNSHGDIFFIDCDHSDFYPPYYDVFFLIFNELMNGNGAILEFYLNDDIFRERNLINEKIYKQIDFFFMFAHYYWSNRVVNIMNDQQKKRVNNLMEYMYNMIKGRLGYGRGIDKKKHIC